MSWENVEEFAKVLVQCVRDRAIRSTDGALQPNARHSMAMRWRNLGVPSDALREVIPDIVDHTLFALLFAIDDEQLRLKFITETGKELDLLKHGDGLMAGWYSGSDGWRDMFSNERYFDDVADEPQFYERGKLNPPK